MTNYLHQRDFSRNSGDSFANTLLDHLKTFEYPPKFLYDTVANYAEKEQQFVLMMKLGLIEPENKKGEKVLNEYKEINKPAEYENVLGKRKLKK